MFRWQRGLAFVLLPWFTGCIEAVMLGRECVANLDACEVDDAPGPMPSPPLDAAVDVDARVVDASGDAVVASDGAVIDADLTVPDGGSLGSPLRFPALANGSFELTRGSPGQLAFEPVDLLPLGSTLADPWVACRFGLNAVTRAESTRGSGVQDVEARDGEVFVDADLGIAGLTGLRQKLAVPLERGQRYGFRIDVRGTPGSTSLLEVWGAYLDCAKDGKLAEVTAPADGWESVCVNFEPNRDFTQLMLVPTIRGLAGASPRVFFDNLREDPSCR